jgi:hypothetical protein
MCGYDDFLKILDETKWYKKFKKNMEHGTP